MGASLFNSVLGALRRMFTFTLNLRHQTPLFSTKILAIFNIQLVDVFVWLPYYVKVGKVKGWWFHQLKIHYELQFPTLSFRPT